MSKCSLFKRFLSSVRNKPEGLSLGSKIGIVAGVILGILVIVAGCLVLIRKRREARRWGPRTSRRYSFGQNVDQGPVSGRLKPKDETEMENVPKATAIRYPDDDDMILAGGRTQY